MQSNLSKMNTDEKQESSLATKPSSGSFYIFCALADHFGLVTLSSFPHPR